jgi:outer membrane lipoprotein SlyB
MKSAIFASAALALALTFLLSPVPAEAKGCLKGAALGGAAGHVVHHGVAGAVGGCIVGHHLANEKSKQSPAAETQHQPAPQSIQSSQSNQ